MFIKTLFFVMLVLTELWMSSGQQNLRAEINRSFFKNRDIMRDFDKSQGRHSNCPKRKLIKAFERRFKWVSDSFQQESNRASSIDVANELPKFFLDFPNNLSNHLLY